MGQMALCLFLKHLSLVPETTANNITDSDPKLSSSSLGPVPFQLAPSKAYLKKRLALRMVPCHFLTIYLWQYECVKSPRMPSNGGWWPPLGVPGLCFGEGVSKSRFLFQWHQWPRSSVRLLAQVGAGKGGILTPSSCSTQMNCVPNPRALTLCSKTYLTVPI